MISINVTCTVTCTQRIWTHTSSLFQSLPVSAEPIGGLDKVSQCTSLYMNLWFTEESSQVEKCYIISMTYIKDGSRHHSVFSTVFCAVFCAVS